MAGLTHASPTVEGAIALAGPRRRATRRFEAWRRFRRHHMAVASVVILALLASAVLFGPLIYRVPINEIDFTARLSSPSFVHPFGTDDLGQDVLARMLYGGRISLAVGFSAMAFASCCSAASPRAVFFHSRHLYSCAMRSILQSDVKIR